MKCMHLSDLHLGKRLMDVSLLEDQAYILQQILRLIDQEQPDALLIAGDVYDRANPPAEAIRLLDDFLQQLAQRRICTFIISGNHDSAERLTYARSFLAGSRIYIAPLYDGHIQPITLTDAHGEVCFWLMPYLHPEQVAGFFPGREIRTAHDAAAAVLSSMQPDPGKRNVMLSHQFIVGGATSDSERRTLGTLEDVGASLYDAFDYVALGHLHRPQQVGRSDGSMRYCGTPLPYSRSEMNGEKSVALVTLGAPGEVSVRTLPLQPLRALRLARGPFDELLRTGPAPGACEDYYFIDLTDEEDVPNAAARLRARFPRLLALNYDNQRTRSLQEIDAPDAVEEKSPLTLMMELYQLTHQQPMSSEAIRFVQETMKHVEGMQP